MSEMDDIKQKNINQLNHMSTEELEELLKAHSQTSDIIEMEYVFSILEVIEKREKSSSSGKYTDIDTAWDSFQSNYRPAHKESTSLYDFSDDSDDNSVYHLDNVRKRRQPVRHKTFIRAACVIASLVIVLFSGSIVARALGYDLWKLVAQWTSDTFGFSSTSSYEEVLPTIQEQGGTKNFADLQEALDHYKITTKLAPSWLPDGYIPHDINVNETPMQTTIHSVYILNDHEIVIMITSFNKPSNRIYEKDGENIIVYTSNGTAHYIISNLDQTNIVWHTDNYECSISGVFSIDDAKKIINSIYERT